MAQQVSSLLASGCLLSGPSAQTLMRIIRVVCSCPSDLLLRSEKVVWPRSHPSLGVFDWSETIMKGDNEVIHSLS